MALRNEVSSIPRAVTFPTLPGSSTRGVPWSFTASITVHQQTPSSLATPDTGLASSPTCLVASIPARCVRSPLGGTCSAVSVQVFAWQSLSPPSFHPDKSCRSSKAWKISDIDAHPVFGLRPYSTFGTPNDSALCLDIYYQLVWGLMNPKYLEPVKSEQCFSQRSRIVHS